MNWNNHKALMNVMTVSAMLLVAGYSAHPSFAAIGDSPLEAYFLAHDTEMTGIIGLDYTSDYYKVIVPATGRFVVRLYDIHLNDVSDGLHVSLLRTTQNSVGTNYFTYQTYVAESKNGSETPDIIDIPDLARGIYFVKIWPQTGWVWDGASYKVKAEFTVFPPIVSDDVGDKKQYALPVVNQLATICTLSGSNDVDYFECQLPYNTNLTLSLTGIGAGGNVNMEVYTAWDTVIGFATQTGAADELLYLEDLVPGQYFIRIFGQGATQYTFTVRQEFAEATDILDDVGDNLTHAMPLLPGNPSIFCLQPNGEDSDVFSIYQPEDGTVTVDVYSIFLCDAVDDLYVRVLDEYGNAMAQSDNASRIPEHIEINLARGQYFIAVYAQTGWIFDGALYTINAKTSGRDVGDAFNQAMQIHAIPYGSETYGYPYIGLIDSPGDADFFQVVLKDNGFIYLEVDRMLYSNVDVQLFDAYHTLLQASANPDTQPEAIYMDNLDAGVYFIRVYSPDSEVGQYRLTPTIGTPTSTISDDIADGTSRAFPLIPYRRVNGFIGGDGTSDYFMFTLGAASSLVHIRVDNQVFWDQSDDIRLHVYNGSGAQIGFSDNDVCEDECVELNNLGAGTYYAKIVPETGWIMDPVQYCITVETDAAPLPSAGLLIPADLLGIPKEIVYVPVILDNTWPPEEITSMSIGVQFDPSLLEPLGVSNSGLTLEQWNTQVRYSRSVNTISVSMNNFSAIESSELLTLIFQVRPTAAIGDASALTMSVSLLNGAIVPWADGLVTIGAN